MKVKDNKIDADLRCKIDELWKLWKSKGIPAMLHIGLSDDYYDAFSVIENDTERLDYYVNYVVMEVEE